MNNSNDPVDQQELSKFKDYALARTLDNFHGLSIAAKAVYSAWRNSDNLPKAMDELVEVLEAVGIDLDGDEDGDDE